MMRSGAYYITGREKDKGGNENVLFALKWGRADSIMEKRQQGSGLIRNERGALTGGPE